MSEAISVLPPRNLGTLAAQFAEIAIEAGAAIMTFYGHRCAMREKADRSFVTEADEAAERIVLAGLRDVLPNVPVVAEEAVSRGGAPEVGREFALVDPLDGTLEFLKQNGEFTVNIALVRDAAPVCGVVFAPALMRLWIGAGDASASDVGPDWRLPPAGARQRIQVRARPNRGLVALSSRSHGDPATEAFLASLPISARSERGSSLKFCLLAGGEADVYARLGPTMEWDTAAGDAILRAAGGVVEDARGVSLRYGNRAGGFRNPGFVAWGGKPAS